jgi:hypothetical protein
MIRFGKKYRLLSIDFSPHSCHLRVIIDRDMRDTSEVGGIGAFAQTW